MIEKRFTMKGSTILENGDEITAWDCCDLLNELHEKNTRLNIQIQRERAASTKQHFKWSKEAETKIKELVKENEQLKKVLGAILLEVKRDISNTNQTGEIRVFINPDSFNLISEVLRKYGALKEWYE